MLNLSPLLHVPFFSQVSGLLQPSKPVILTSPPRTNPDRLLLNPQLLGLPVKSVKNPQASQPLSLFSPTPPPLPLPPRSPTAPTGSQFWAAIQNLSGQARENAIKNAILSGNIPDHLRSFKPLELSLKDKTGQIHQATAYVLPDYLAIGSNQDYVLVPMSPITAQAIADQTQSLLPTRRVVDKIYQAAEVKLSPKPQTPGPQMMSTAYYQRHDETIQGQREKAGAQPGQLISGHKKDLVITNRLDQKPKSVAIYGWHQASGKAIQPLSTIHENTYADYSHGVRLMAETMLVNGQVRSTAEVLRDPTLAPLLSDEGVIKNPRAVRP